MSVVAEKSDERLICMKEMTLVKNIFIATGTLAFLYVILKLFAKVPEKDSKKESDKESDKIDHQTDEKTMETGESKPKLFKRKLEEPEAVAPLPKLKPNFFFAIQVNNVGIHRKVKKLQEKVITKNPLLFPALVNVSTLHVTLAVTHLASENDINAVKKKLDEWAEVNLDKYFNKPCILSFTGVKTFNNAVAYVDVEQCDNYKRVIDLSNNMKNILTSLGFTTEKRFTPHLTILKLSNDVNLLRTQRKFKHDFETLKECKEHFGKQEINHIQLLSIDEPKDEFGYYKCFHEIKVSDVKPNMDHKECCTPIVKPRRTVK